MTRNQLYVFFGVVALALLLNPGNDPRVDCPTNMTERAIIKDWLKFVNPSINSDAFMERMIARMREMHGMTRTCQSCKTPQCVGRILGKVQASTMDGNREINEEMERLTQLTKDYATLEAQLATGGDKDYI